MISFPSLKECALFLDVDGTLVDIITDPQKVVFDEELQLLLKRLAHHTDQRCSLVSGRDLKDLRRLLYPIELPLISNHGALIHMENNELYWHAPIDNAQHLAIASTIQTWANNHRPLEVEVKSHSIAIHYRKAPLLEKIVLSHLKTYLKHYSDYEILKGKMVKELKRTGFNKGRTIGQLMEHPRFRGKCPVMIGDDTTDEFAFKWVNDHQGISIKVGSSHLPSAANFKLDSPTAVKAQLGAWLTSWL